MSLTNLAGAAEGGDLASPEGASGLCPAARFRRAAEAIQPEPREARRPKRGRRPSGLSSARRFRRRTDFWVRTAAIFS